MNGFVTDPNLPIRCTSIIIGEKYSGFFDKPLESLSIEPIYVPDNPYISEKLSGHCDLSVFHAGENRLFLAPNLNGSRFSDKVREKGVEIEYLPVNQGKIYPNDAQLNACAVGKNLICNINTLSPEIVNYFTSKGTNIISCRQGYTRCSVCVVDDNSIITSDRGAASACSSAGMNVLQISPGNIDLPGYEYGFIGGSAFKISADKLAFTGNLNMHPDRNKIFDFLKFRNVEPVFLTENPVFDIGSAVPLTEALY